MKRFFLISALLHGILLLLLFTWEAPTANQALSQNIVEVFLVEKAEEKKEENKPAPRKPREKKNLEPAPQIAADDSEEKRENRRKAGIVTNQIEPKEERKPIEEKAPSEERTLRTKGEEPPIIQTEQVAQAGGGGDSKEYADPAANLQVSGVKGKSGTTFVASIGPGLEIGEIQAGKERKGSGLGKEDGLGQVSHVRTSDQEGDSIHLEIMRRIEGAKRYPKAARKMHIEGRATVRFKIKPDGKVDSVEVVESSGSDILTRHPWKPSSGLSPCLSRKDG
jgi:protein TonB